MPSVSNPLTSKQPIHEVGSTCVSLSCLSLVPKPQPKPCSAAVATSSLASSDPLFRPFVPPSTAAWVPVLDTEDTEEMQALPRSWEHPWVLGELQFSQGMVKARRLSSLLGAGATPGH